MPPESHSSGVSSDPPALAAPYETVIREALLCLDPREAGYRVNASAATIAAAIGPLVAGEIEAERERFAQAIHAKRFTRFDIDGIWREGFNDGLHAAVRIVREGPE